MTAPVRRLKFKRADGVSDVPGPLPRTTNPTVRDAIGNPSNMFDGVQVFSTTMMQMLSRALLIF